MIAATASPAQITPAGVVRITARRRPSTDCQLRLQPYFFRVGKGGVRRNLVIFLFGSAFGPSPQPPRASFVMMACMSAGWPLTTFSCSSSNTSSLCPLCDFARSQ